MPEEYKYEKILVVDDTSLDRLIAEKIVKKTWFAESVIGVESARAGLDHIIAHANDLPDFIFLDINMPLMNGFDFLNEYDKLPGAVRKKSIVMLSSSLSDIDKGRASGNPYVIKFISKPLNAEALADL